VEKNFITIVQRTLMVVGVAFLLGAIFSLIGGQYMSVMVCTVAAVVFIAPSLAINFFVKENAKSKANLLQNGQLIQADIIEIGLNDSIDINGRSPFRIIAQWHDKTNNKIYIYKSANIWFDPKPFVSSEKVQVYVDLNDRSKHHMDISFLPKRAN
jgi:hypothetical protein